MNRARKFIGIFGLISLVVLAGRSEQTPNDAAIHCAKVQQYLRHGYVIDQVTLKPACTTEACGARHWGAVTLNLHGRQEGLHSLETTYATVDTYLDVEVIDGKETFVVADAEINERLVF